MAGVGANIFRVLLAFVIALRAFCPLALGAALQTPAATAGCHHRPPVPNSGSKSCCSASRHQPALVRALPDNVTAGITAIVVARIAAQPHSDHPVVCEFGVDSDPPLRPPSVLRI